MHHCTCGTWLEWLTDVVSLCPACGTLWKSIAGQRELIGQDAKIVLVARNIRQMREQGENNAQIH